MTFGTDEEKAVAEARAKQFYESHKAKVDENWVKKNPLKNNGGSSSTFSSAASSSSSSSSSMEEFKVPFRLEMPLFLPQVEGVSNILQSDAEAALLSSSLALFVLFALFALCVVSPLCIFSASL